MLVLPRISNAKLSSVVQVALPSTTGVVTLSGSERLFADGHVVTTPYSANALEALEVELQIPATSSATIYCCIYVDALPWAIASATSESTTQRLNYPQYEDFGPFDIHTYPDGFPFYTTNLGASATDGLTEIDEQGQILGRIPSSTVVDESVDPLLDFVLYGDTLWYVDHYRDLVRRVNLPDKQTLPPIQLPEGSRPYALGATALYTFFVSLTGANKVAVFDSVWRSKLFEVEALGPKGLYVGPDNAVFVAESGSNTVLRIDAYNYSIRRIVVGARPIEICADTTGIYVTCLDDTLWKISSTGTVITHVSTGRDPIGVLCAQNKVFVANSFDNKVSVYDQNLVKLADIQTHNEPQFLAQSGSELAVGCQGENRVERFSLTDFTKIGHTEVPALIFGLVHHEASWYVFSGNSGIPTRTFIIDSSVKEFGFTPLYAVTLSTFVESSTALIEGFDPQLVLQCSIPPIPGVTLYKNNIAVPQGSTFVANGDEIRLSLTSSPEYNTRVVVPVTVGDYTVEFVVLTLMFDDLVNAVWFNPTQAREVGTQIFSNEVMVDGMTPGFTVTCSIDSGSLYLNGELVPSGSAIVHNGDLVKLSQTSAEGSVWTTYTMGDHVTTWHVYYGSEPTELIGIPTIPVLFNAEPFSTNHSQDAVVHTTLIYDGNWYPPVVVGSKPVKAYPLPGYNLYKNGVLLELAEGQFAEFKDGDRISMDGVAAGFEYENTFSYAIIDNQLISFSVRTRPDKMPYPVLLADSYGTLPRTEYETIEFPAEGISGPDADIPISVDWGKLFINGVDRGASSTVRLHDLVKWVAVAEGPYSGVLTYHMQFGQSVTTWKLHNVSLDGARLNHDDYLAGVYGFDFMSARAVESSRADARDSCIVSRPLNSFLDPLPYEQFAQFCNLSQGLDAILLPSSITPEFERSFYTYASGQAPEYERQFSRPEKALGPEFEMGFIVGTESPAPEFSPGFAALDKHAVPEFEMGFDLAHSGSIVFESVFDVSTHSAPYEFSGPFHVVAQTFQPWSREFVVERPVEASKFDTGFEVLLVRSTIMADVFATKFSGPQINTFSPVGEKFNPTVVLFAVEAVLAQPLAPVPSLYQLEPARETPILARTYDRQAVAQQTRVHTVVRAGTTVSKLSQSTFTYMAMLERGLNYKQTDFPAYDGKFSTVKLAAKQAAINGYPDAEVFLDQDNRYIYRGVCAIRLMYNTCGWIRGG